MSSNDRDGGQEPGYVIREDRDGVAYITLNRPKALNALNPIVIGQLAQVFDAADADPKVRAIVFAGEGKAFVAGADIGFFIKNIQEGQVHKIVEFTSSGQEIFKRIDDSPKMVIARMDGLALGGGAELALCADTIVATPEATMGFPETGIGIYPGLGGTQRTARYVGPELAKFLVMTGRTLTAAEALEIGLVEYVVEPGEIEGMIHDLATSGRAITKNSRGPVAPTGDWLKIKDWFGPKNIGAMIDGGAKDDPDPLKAKTAKTISFKAPLAVGLADRIIDEGHPLPLAEGLQLEVDHMAEIFSTADALEGMTSLVEKRRPEFKGQ